jgi:hypothetical protein
VVILSARALELVSRTGARAGEVYRLTGITQPDPFKGLAGAVPRVNAGLRRHGLQTCALRSSEPLSAVRQPSRRPG